MAGSSGEDNNLGSRIARYARVGTTMGGLAARLAGERYLGLKVERDQHAGELRAALGGLKGPLMKVAQILSTIPDAVPKEYQQALSELQADAPSMGGPFVRRRMSAELGPDWQKRFASFDLSATAAASLGQVHRAVHLDGRALACKLQYPEMQSAVEADLKQLQVILGLFERYDRAVSTRHVQTEIGDRLREELDYEREARHIGLYREMMSQTPGVNVPEVIPELSTGRLLTMTWMQGNRILSYVDAPADLRNALAVNMFRAWYIPFYYYGVIHGDPHLGNYSIAADNSINLMDFGCVRVFRPIFVKGVIDLYRALETNDEALAMHAYESWGFPNLTRELASVLNVWARFIYGPVLEDRTRQIEEIRTGQYGRATAEKVHAELKRVGGVEVPREFVFMDRAAVGLGSVFMHLHAEVNWHRIFHELIDGFDNDALIMRQQTTLARFNLEPL